MTARRERQRATAATPGDDPRVILSLYISGPTPRSAQAIVNVRKLCEEHLHGRYALAVIDLSQTPALAAQHQIIAAPTLVRELPLPERRFIGDMSNGERILAGLDVVVARAD
jgi:circadian clock protein KaiB